MPEKKLFSYSYKLEDSNTDTFHKNVPMIDLPENMTAAGFAHIVKYQNFESGRIKLVKTEKIVDANLPSKIIHTISKTIVLYVDKKVQTDAELHKMLKNKYNNSRSPYLYYSPQKTQNMPAVMIGNVIMQRGARSLNTEDEIEWIEHHPVVESLKPDQDILVNHDLQEIWPESTGAIPEIVQKFFENER